MDPLRTAFEAEPYLAYLGLEIAEASPEAVVLRLPLRRELSNHAGTLHAGALHAGAQYSLGEATAAALATMVFFDRLAHGDLTAWASLASDERQRILDEFAASGRSRFPVAVEITDATGATVTTLDVDCVMLTRREAP